MVNSGPAEPGVEHGFRARPIVPGHIIEWLVAIDTRAPSHLPRW